jgi:hypothetical protein
MLTLLLQGFLLRNRELMTLIQHVSAIVTEAYVRNESVLHGCPIVLFTSSSVLFMFSRSAAMPSRSMHVRRREKAYTNAVKRTNQEKKTRSSIVLK